MKIAVLDDYQHAALEMADWGAVSAAHELDLFDTALAVPDEAAAALAPYEAICLMRERMAVPRALIERLPRLRLICVTGAQNRTLDLAAATERGIVVSHTENSARGAAATPELAWALVLAAARHLHHEDRRMREGGWQSTVGITLAGRTLGLLGLGRIGRVVAGYGRAFGMRVIAWSPNLTADAAAAQGVARVEKDVLFAESDVVSIHLVLGERSRGLVGAADLARMKPSAILVNTSRGPIVDEAALVAALEARRIAAAGLDVYDHEPLPADHPLRRLPNTVLAPHLGYVVEEGYRDFYAQTVENLLAFAAGRPVRVLNPEVLGAARG